MMNSNGADAQDAYWNTCLGRWRAAAAQAAAGSHPQHVMVGNVIYRPEMPPDVEADLELPPLLVALLREVQAEHDGWTPEEKNEVAQRVQAAHIRSCQAARMFAAATAAIARRCPLTEVSRNAARDQMTLLMAPCVSGFGNDPSAAFCHAFNMFLPAPGGSCPEDMYRTRFKSQVMNSFGKQLLNSKKAQVVPRPPPPPPPPPGVVADADRTRRTPPGLPGPSSGMMPRGRSSTRQRSQTPDIGYEPTEPRYMLFQHTEPQ